MYMILFMKGRYLVMMIVVALVFGVWLAKSGNWDRYIQWIKDRLR